MVRTLDLWLAVAGSNPGHDTAMVIFWDRWPYFAGKLSWDITTTQVNSALHPSGVAKSSTSFGWGKGGKVTSAGWQVTLCDLIWHVISRSGVVISIANCYIRFTLLLLYNEMFTKFWKSLLFESRDRIRNPDSDRIYLGGRVRSPSTGTPVS